MRGFVQPASPPRIVLQSTLGQASCSDFIGGNERTGWYLPLTDPLTYSPTLLKWDTTGALQSTPLQNAEDINIETAMHGMLPSRFIIGGMRRGATGPMKFIEVTRDNGSWVSTFECGDKKSRWGAGTETANGGFFACAYVDSLPKTSIVLDIVYRRPEAPYPSGAEPPTWFHERRTLSATTQSGLFTFCNAVEFDGFLWVFIVRDSAGTVALLRYKLADKLIFWDEQPEFIPRGLGPVSIMAEAPILTAVADPRNKRIVLAYQSFEDRFVPACIPTDFVSHWSVVEVKPGPAGPTCRLLGETPWWTPHEGLTKPLIVPRPDGIWFALEAMTTNDCARNWKLGRLRTTFEVTDTLPRGSILSLSKDGWMMFLDRTAQPFATSHLMKLRFPPRMVIHKCPGGLRVNWDESWPGDQLEQSDDVVNWSPMTHSPAHPLTLPATGPSRFFRVRP